MNSNILKEQIKPQIFDHLLKGDPARIFAILRILHLSYYYDSGDIYISEIDYHNNKNYFAKMGVI